MADVTMQGIEFEITGNADKANSSLKKLANTLGKLKSATQGGLGLKAISQELDDFSKVVKNLDFSNVTGMAKAVKGIGSASGKIGTAASSLRDISQLDFSNLTNAQEVIGNLAAASKNITGGRSSGGAGASTAGGAVTPVEFGTTEIGSTSETIENVAERTEKASSRIRDALSQMSDSIMSANSAWKSLGPYVSEAASHLSEFGRTASQDIHDVFSNLKSIIGESMSGIGEKITGSLSGIGAKFSPILDGAKTVFSGVTKAAKYAGATMAQPFVAAEQLIGSALERISPTASNVFGKLSSGLKSIVSSSATAAQSIGGALSSGLSTITSKAASAASFLGGKLASGLKTAASGAARLASSMVTLPFSGVASKLQSVSASIGKFASSLKRILMYRAVRGILSSITSGLKEGINNLYQYSNALGGQFARSMDSASTSMQYLKNSLAAMVSPLINALAPVLDAIISRIVTLLNLINQLFALLGGSGVYTRATKAAKSYGGAVGGAAGAAKQLMDYTLGFDELNVFKPDSGGGGGGGGGGAGGYADMFETVPIDLEIPQELQDIFKVFKDAWDQEGAAVIEAATRALTSLKELAIDIGETFYHVFTDGYGFDWLVSVFQLLTSVLNLVADIADAFKAAWDENDRGYYLLVSIFTMITNINNLWTTLIETFREAWNENERGQKIIGNILEIFTNFNNIVGNLTKRFQEAWAVWGKEIWGDLLDIINTVLAAINEITSATAEWAASVDFEPFLKSIDSLLKAIDSLVGVIADGLVWAWENVLLPLASWTIEEAGPAVIDALAAAIEFLSSVITALQPVGEWLWDNFLQPIAEWTGEKIISVLETLTSAFQKLTDLISGNTSFSDFLNSLSTGETVAVAIIAIATALGTFAVAAGIASVAAGALGAVFAVLTSPITLVIAAIAAVVVAGVKLYQNWDKIKAKAKELKDAVVEKFNEIKEKVTEKIESVRDFVETAFQNIKTFIETPVGKVRDFVETAFQKIKSFIEDPIGTARNFVETALKKIQTFIETPIGKARDFVKNAGNKIQTFIEDPIGSARDFVDGAFKKIQAFIEDPIGTARDFVEEAVGKISDFFNLETLVTKVSGFFDDIRDSIKTPIETARDIVKDAIEKIKGFFNFTFTWPNLPLPHFSISPPGWSIGDLLKGSIPSLGVSWYAKGGVIDGATLIGAGEAGAEAIVPLERNTQWINRVAEQLYDRMAGPDNDTTDDRPADIEAGTASLLNAVNTLIDVARSMDLSVSIGDGDIYRANERYSRSRGYTVNPGTFANAY